MAASRSSPGSSWPDLPSELLGLVLLRTPRHADRVRLRAVCRPWRCNARLQPLPPPLPWVALPDGTFLSLPDGAVHRVPAVPDDDDVSQRLSAGSMLFLVHRGSNTCCLTSPCSAAITPLPELAFCFLPEYMAAGYYGTAPRVPEFSKLVASDHLVAALTKCNRVAVSPRRPPQGANSCSTSASTSTMMWSPPICSDEAVDIAFFQGKLYVLTLEERGQKELHVLDTSCNNRGSSSMDVELKSVQCIRSVPRKIDHSRAPPQRWFDPYSTEYCEHKLYQVASGDRLMLVEREINQPPLMPFEEPKVYRTRSFEVFQAAGLGTGLGRWSKVDTLMGHALFVSKGCCSSLPLAAAGQSCAAGAREDSVYFINERAAHLKQESSYGVNEGTTRNKIMYEDPILDSGVYNIRDRTMMPLPLEATVLPKEGPWRPTWLFPAET